MKQQVSRRNKRYKAKRLFFTHKYTSRQIAAMVDVTEATMSKWVKQNGWKDPDTAGAVSLVTTFSIVSASFYEHLELNNPKLLVLVKDEISTYVKVSSGAGKARKDLETQIKELYAKMDLDEFGGINISDLPTLSKNKLNRLLDQLTEYSKPAIELTIKKVTA